MTLPPKTGSLFTGGFIHFHHAIFLYFIIFQPLKFPLTPLLLCFSIFLIPTPLSLSLFLSLLFSIFIRYLFLSHISSFTISFSILIHSLFSLSSLFYSLYHFLSIPFILLFFHFFFFSLTICLPFSSLYSSLLHIPIFSLHSLTIYTYPLSLYIYIYIYICIYSLNPLPHPQFL